MKRSLTKSAKIILLLLSALILAVGAGFAIYTYCNSQKVFIYYFNADYAAGTPISASMLTSMEVDKTIAENGKTGSINDRYITEENLKLLLGTTSYLLYDVHKGQALTYAVTSSVGKTAIEYNLEEGKIAVTVPINNITGVTSALRTGVYVNIYSSQNGTTKLFLEHMKIIAVNKSDGSLQSVTFECTNTQAIDLIYAQTYAELYFGLTDYAPEIQETATEGDVTNGQ